MSGSSPTKKTARSGGSLDRRTRAELIGRLRDDARRIAERFDLSYDAIEAESVRVKRRYGSCREDGRIRIRLTHARTGRPLKYSSMVDTLCHELAHLKHFNHGPRFKAFYVRLLDWARREGIYRPVPRRRGQCPSLWPRAAGTLQMSLFGEDSARWTSSSRS